MQKELLGGLIMDLEESENSAQQSVQRTAGIRAQKWHGSGFRPFPFAGIFSSRPCPPLTRAVETVGKG